MYRVAHISDLHLPPLPPVHPRELMSKRLLGFLSWHKRRKQDHLQSVLDVLQADLEHAAPDHICVTGDLTNITLTDEVDNATAWLERLAPLERVSLIPGNHDAYVPGALDYALEQWAPWMRDDDGRTGFPYLHRRGPVDIVGLSSAVASLPALSGGRLGAEQIARCERLLAERNGPERPCLLLVHHPPHNGACAARRALWDRGALQAMLRRQPVDAVLFGHLHYPVRGTLEGAKGPIPALGAGAASTVGRRKGPAHYHLLELDEAAGGCSITLQHRYYDPDTAAFRAGEGCRL